MEMGVHKRARERRKHGDGDSNDRQGAAMVMGGRGSGTELEREAKRACFDGQRCAGGGQVQHRLKHAAHVLNVPARQSEIFIPEGSPDFTGAAFGASRSVPRREHQLSTFFAKEIQIKLKD